MDRRQTSGLKILFAEHGVQFPARNASFGAGKTAAVIFNNSAVFSIPALTADIEPAFAGPERTVTRLAGRDDAIKSIDARRDAVKKIGHPANAQEMPRFVLRQKWHRPGKLFEELGLGAPERRAERPAHREAVEGHRPDRLGALPAQILKSTALGDAIDALR